MPSKAALPHPLTPLELEIMNVLWQTGPAAVQTVQSELKTRELAYTTVQTMLNVLHRKGKVKRRLKDRAYLYQPVLTRERAVKQALTEMLDKFFGGSADNLLLNLVETRHLTPEKLARLQQMVANSKEDSHGNR